MDQTNHAAARSRAIVRVSVTGIAVNLVLVVFKAIVGLLAGSIAIVLDAVNNFSDALSSVITIIGTKLAGRAPDKKHPYGHGRIEYITAMIIAVIILAAGGTALWESVQKIIHPTAAEYSVPFLIIIAAAVATKVFLGLFFKRRGKALRAETLVASGTDALFDAVVSFATLVGALISYFWHVHLEGYLGILIGLFILKAGVEILGQSLGSIIGIRTDSALTERLRAFVSNYPEVQGVYDMALHNYGPEHVIGSLHVQVPDTMNAREIHRLTRAISVDVYRTFGIVLTIGIYAAQGEEGEGARIKAAVDAIVAERPEVLQLHGFYVDEAEKTVTFDLVVDFKANATRVRDEIVAALTPACPGYTIFVVLDSDYSD